jgi:hypothetical protein
VEGRARSWGAGGGHRANRTWSSCGTGPWARVTSASARASGGHEGVDAGPEPHTRGGGRRTAAHLEVGEPVPVPGDIAHSHANAGSVPARFVLVVFEPVVETTLRAEATDASPARVAEVFSTALRSSQRCSRCVPTITAWRCAGRRTDPSVGRVAPVIHEVYRTCDLRLLHWLMRIGVPSGDVDTHWCGRAR